MFHISQLSIVVVDVYHQPSTAALKQKNPAPMTKATDAGCVD